MGRYCPGKRSVAALALLAACFAACAAGDADAQAANALNLSGLPLSPSLFQHPAPTPLTPDPGGAFTSPAAMMPVPPLARTTIPNVDGAQTPDTQAAAEQDSGDAHAALDDKALDRVR